MAGNMGKRGGIIPATARAPHNAFGLTGAQIEPKTFE